MLLAAEHLPLYVDAYRYIGSRLRYFGRNPEFARDPLLLQRLVTNLAMTRFAKRQAQGVQLYSPNYIAQTGLPEAIEFIESCGFGVLLSSLTCMVPVNYANQMMCDIMQLPPERVCAISQMNTTARSAYFANLAESYPLSRHHSLNGGSYVLIDKIRTPAGIVETITYRKHIRDNTGAPCMQCNLHKVLNRSLYPTSADIAKACKDMAMRALPVMKKLESLIRPPPTLVQYDVASIELLPS